jgi:hypothetical protein
LSEQRFIGYFNDAPETGMGYFVVTAILKDGRKFEQVVVVGLNVTMTKGYVHPLI